MAIDVLYIVGSRFSSIGILIQFISNDRKANPKIILMKIEFEWIAISIL